MDIDINALRSLTTVLGLIGFIGIIGWAFSPRHAADFEQAAKLPFEQD